MAALLCGGLMDGWMDCLACPSVHDAPVERAGMSQLGNASLNPLAWIKPLGLGRQLPSFWNLSCCSIFACSNRRPGSYQGTRWNRKYSDAFSFFDDSIMFHPAA